MLSIIFLSYYSGERISIAYSKLKSLLGDNNIAFEFLVIDDGSGDDSYKIALDLEQSNENVRAYQLSRNYTSHYSIFAGLSLCKGDCAIPISDDEQQPYQTIVDIFRIWKNGEKIIIPYRVKRDDGFLSNLAAGIYYRTINALSEVKFPKGGADVFFIDREIIDILVNRIHHINTSSIIEVLRLGYEPAYFPFERVKGTNHKSRWTFKKKVRLFKDTFYSSSTWPVKVITRMGFFFSFIAFLMILFYSCITLFGNWEFWGEYVPGWTSTVVIISFFSGIILFSLGIIAEYIWRIYEEVKNRPGYIIKKKPGDNSGP
jgi:glycosyltransferase involved in cell wall biosynthesis